MGLAVSAGGEVDLDYQSRYFLPGALVRLMTLLACVGIPA